jgi:hypothetical protein
MTTFRASSCVLASALFCTSLGHAAESPAPAAGSSTPASAIYALTGAGSVLDKAGGAAPQAVGSLQVVLPLIHYASLELMGSAGYVRGDGSSPDDMWLRLGLGARIEDTHRAFRPYGSLRFVHIHYATAETWKDYPVDSLLGSSSAGLQHRSGMALAFGVSWRIPHTDGKLRAMAELEGSWVPIGDPPAWAAMGEVGLGYAF